MELLFCYILVTKFSTIGYVDFLESDINNIWAGVVYSKINYSVRVQSFTYQFKKVYFKTGEIKFS